MRLLCLGDSNTYGYDPRSYFGGRYPVEVRWTDRLAQATGWTIINLGMNGRCIPANPMQLPDADGLIVMLGSNDLLNGCSALEAARRMEDFLGLVCSAFPLVLLVAPPPMEYGDWVTDSSLLHQSRLLSAHYEELAKKLNICFSNSGDWNVELAFDGVHFSEAGHLAFCGGIYQTLSNLLCTH